jgi:16S rRNA (cytosine967-C5)-methyltransferase
MIAPARIAAFRVLQAVGRGDAQPAALLAREHQRQTDPRDRALATEIVIGTLRWQRALDAAIAVASARSAESLDRDVAIILRLSLYQLRHLDRVPAAAVVDDAVSLVRSAQGARATGFVNAVLHVTHRDQLGLPPRPARTRRARRCCSFGVTQSHPDWLAARLIASLSTPPASRQQHGSGRHARANRLAVSRDDCASWRLGTPNRGHDTRLTGSW